MILLNVHISKGANLGRVYNMVNPLVLPLYSVCLFSELFNLDRRPNGTTGAFPKTWSWQKLFFVFFFCPPLNHFVPHERTLTYHFGHHTGVSDSGRPLWVVNLQTGVFADRVDRGHRHCPRLCHRHARTWPGATGVVDLARSPTQQAFHAT